MRREAARGLLLPVAVLGVAAFLRLHRLAEVPSGLLHDEASNGVDALRILAGWRPVFLPDNFGREALFIYLQAASVGLLGPSDLALRLVAAGVGLLTVAVSHALVRRLFGPRVALLAAAWLALSLWHVIFSRIGLRSVSLPLFAAAALYCLWRGLDAAGAPDRWRWHALAGLGLGLTLYTYTAARALPLALLGFAGYLALLHRPALRAALPGLALTTLVALATVTPLGVYFARHPRDFVARARDVSVLSADAGRGGPLAALADASAKTLGALSLAGDVYWDRNWPGRPILDPATSALAALGLALAVRRVRQPRYAFLLVWLAAMLLPSALASRDVPNHLRLTGLIPALFALPALGLDRLWATWERRAPGRLRPAGALLVAVAFAIASLATYRDYFVRWAAAPEVRAVFNAERWAGYVALRRALPPTGSYFLAAADAADPLARYAFSGGDRSGGGRADRLWLFDGARSAVFLPNPGPLPYLYPADRPPSERVRQEVFGGQAGEVLRAPGGEPTLLRYQLTGRRPTLAPSRPLPARFGEALRVAGFDLPTDVRAGEGLDVGWHWRLLDGAAPDLGFSSQLFDAAGRRWAQWDGPGFAAGYWPAGTTGLTTFTLLVPLDAPTGAYWLQAGVYQWPGVVGLPVLDEQGRPAGEYLRVGPLKVRGRTERPPVVPTPLAASFADQVELLGFDLDASQGTPGGSLAVTLYWSARGRPSRDYTVFVHLLDEQGRLRAQADAPPRGGAYPTSVWDAGEVVVDAHRLGLGAELPRDVYRLGVGLYEPETGRRLAREGGADRGAGDLVLLGRVKLR